LSIYNKSKKSSKLGDAINTLKPPDSRRFCRQKSSGDEIRLMKRSLAREIRKRGFVDREASMERSREKIRCAASRCWNHFVCHSAAVKGDETQLEGAGKSASRWR
jgi:hypothetical protein